MMKAVMNRQANNTWWDLTDRHIKESSLEEEMEALIFIIYRVPRPISLHHNQ